jgi:hypothetical protein
MYRFMEGKGTPDLSTLALLGDQVEGGWEIRDRTRTQVQV